MLNFSYIFLHSLTYGFLPNLFEKAREKMLPIIIAVTKMDIAQASLDKILKKLENYSGKILI